MHHEDRERKLQTDWKLAILALRVQLSERGLAAGTDLLQTPKVAGSSGLDQQQLSVKDEPFTGLGLEVINKGDDSLSIPGLVDNDQNNDVPAHALSRRGNTETDLPANPQLPRAEPRKSANQWVGAKVEGWIFSSKWSKETEPTGPDNSWDQQQVAAAPPDLQ